VSFAGSNGHTSLSILEFKNYFSRLTHDKHAEQSALATQVALVPWQSEP
tara:strand:- start:8978 stop:9124 length:147 start_codon:yes stop_codon:yes gene_type:complete